MHNAIHQTAIEELLNKAADGDPHAFLELETFAVEITERYLSLARSHPTLAGQSGKGRRKIPGLIKWDGTPLKTCIELINKARRSRTPVKYSSKKYEPYWPALEDLLFLYYYSRSLDGLQVNMDIPKNSLGSVFAKSIFWQLSNEDRETLCRMAIDLPQLEDLPSSLSKWQHAMISLIEASRTIPVLHQRYLRVHEDQDVSPAQSVWMLLRQQSWRLG